MRILLISDSPYIITAYAQQAVALATSLGKAGHEVVYYAPSYMGVGRNFPHFRLMGQLGVGNMLLVNYYADLFNTDCILTYCDPFVFLDTASWNRPWVALAPVDTEPAAPLLVASLQNAYRVISLTRWGQQALCDAGVYNPAYAPCGADVKFWASGNRLDARRELGIPDDQFLALFVGENTSRVFSRKNLDIILVAWNAFTYAHPERDAKLMLHTDVEQGVVVPHVASCLNIPPHTLAHTDPLTYRAGVSPAGLRALYWAADVLVAPSAGEGFHVPVVEAAACGLPAITSAFTAGREVTGGAGWQIAESGGERFFTHDRGAFWFRPDAASVVDALEKAYDARHESERRAHAQRWAAQYDFKNVFEAHWLPLIAEIEREIVHGEMVHQ